MTYVNRLTDPGDAELARLGGKGANLIELVRAGLPVPPGFVLTTEAYDDFVEANGIGPRIRDLAAPTESGASARAAVSPSTPRVAQEAAAAIRALFVGGTLPARLAGELAAAYAGLGDEVGAGADTAVAVRSSATAEDLESASFAGQQSTFLNVRGYEAVVAAVIDCWASLWTARAMAYRAHAGVGPAGLSLAVVIQQMVEAEASGVMFSANPANGRTDQVVISAAWGLGESVVSGSATTDDLVVDSETGGIRSRRTANKDTMTVYAPAGTREQAVPADLRERPVLDDAAARELARYATRIAGHFGRPQDIEWARTRGAVFIVQSRPITALPEASAEVPTEWPIPYPDGVYFRASIVEQLPDPLSPLFADLIDASVTRSLGDLMRRAFGAVHMREGDIGLPTINGYAYYFYRWSAFLPVLARTVPAVRTLLRGDGRLGVEGWRYYSHPLYQRTVAAAAAGPWELASGPELLDEVVELLDAGTRYYTAVQSVIPLAGMSELLLQAVYNRFVRRPGDPPAQTLLLGYPSEPIRAEESLWDLAQWTKERPELTGTILATSTEALTTALRTGEPPEGADPAAWADWHRLFQAHLDRYGHAVYNLDFMSAVPADDPSTLMGALRFSLGGEGADPHERRRQSAERRDALTRTVLARLTPSWRARFARLLAWAQSAAPAREDALADIGLAWPLMRRMLRELGTRLVASGFLADPDEVFWLREHELREALDQSRAGAPRAESPVYAEAVAARRALWRGRRKAAAPQMLPEARWMSRGLAGMMPAGDEDQRGETITGIGASPGTVTAPARLLTGPEDFDRMRPGDVLVARMTTPAWTALFSMASAVVTDVGGPLSHSSIVAREYGIPAVLGTGVATRRLVSGQDIRVDGDAGTVRVANGVYLPAGSRSGRGRAPGRFGASVLQGVRATVAPLTRTTVFRRFAPTVLPPIERMLSRTSNGRVQLSGLLGPSLVLHTVGARSGLGHDAELMYTPDSNGRAIVAGTSFAHSRHPAWTYNLLAHPDAEITVRGRRMRVRATLIDEPERDPAWRRIEQQWPGYRAYERQSGRTVRLFLLQPLAEPSA